MKRKLFMVMSVLVSLILIIFLASGCLPKFPDLSKSKLVPNTLNLNSKGNGSMTGFLVVDHGVTDDFDAEDIALLFSYIEKIEVGYEGKFTEATIESIRETKDVSTLVAKIDRKELIDILVEAGVLDGDFKGYVELDIAVTLNEEGHEAELEDGKVSCPIRVINPTNAGK